jgi:hypothetical protein
MQLPPAMGNNRLAYMGNAIRSGSIFVGGILIGALGFALFFRTAQGTGPDVAVDLSHHHAVMHDCVTDVIKAISPDQLNAGLYERIWRLCGNQIFNGLYLDDFLIRRQKFIQQELDERVNLWLVVAITASGVILAALQLFMSFKLASEGRLDFTKDSQLAVEAGKISLKSSITGVLILALSLAFFMIYVVYIYSIHEVPLDRPADLRTPAETEDVQPPPLAGPPGSAEATRPPSLPKATKNKK